MSVVIWYFYMVVWLSSMLFLFFLVRWVENLCVNPMYINDFHWNLLTLFFFKIVKNYLPMPTWHSFNNHLSSTSEQKAFHVTSFHVVYLKWVPQFYFISIILTFFCQLYSTRTNIFTLWCSPNNIKMVLYKNIPQVYEPKRHFSRLYKRSCTCIFLSFFYFPLGKILGHLRCYVLYMCV